MSQSPTKRLIFVAISVLLIATMVYGPVFAAATTKALSTNFTLVNLGTVDAAVTVDYLLQGGTAWPNVAAASKSFTLAKNGGQKQVRQYADTMDPGAGSAVVSSSQPLGAVVQIQARNQTATQGAYIGASEGSGTFYIPLVAHLGTSASGAVNSQIIVQNAGTGSVSFTVQLIPTAGSTGTYTKTVPSLAQGASYYYDLSTENNLGTASWFGSAVVKATSSGGSLVVVTNLFSGAHGLQTFNAFPIENLTDKWVVPIFTSKLTNGLSTVVTVQNLSGGTLNAGALTMQCKREGETAFSFTKSTTAAIANNASFSFNPVNQPVTNYPDDYYGACVVTAAGGAKIATFVQMRTIGTSVNTAAYEAVPANQTTLSFFVPLVAKRLSNGFASVVNIANLANTSNTVTLVYTPSPTECPVAICDKSKNGTVGVEDAITITNVSIAANGGNQRNHRTGETALPNGWVGSLRVTSTASKPIGGIVQLTNVNAIAGDTLMAHGTFGQ